MALICRCRSSALRKASCTCCSRDSRGLAPPSALLIDSAPLLGEALRLRLSLFSFCRARLLKGGTVCCLSGSETGALACTVIRQQLEASLAQGILWDPFVLDLTHTSVLIALRRW